MRVLQLIDSLHPGGAERMAVSLANALQTKIDGSYICVTREEGSLKNELLETVNYLFLKRKKKIDFQAIKRLRLFCISNKITHVHAHGTSFFIATQLKIILPTIKLVWHEHYGSRVRESNKNNKILRFCSGYFDQIITVTTELKAWSEQNLKCNKVNYVSNFVDISLFNSQEKRTDRIICLANLKEPKNHIFLLKAFAILSPEFPLWKLVLVGKIFNDSYFNELVTFIEQNELQDKIYFLGGNTDVKNELLSSKIGVLSSSYEGLPMVLLEYGAAGLVPITTDVGFCKEVISTFGGVSSLGELESYIDYLRTYLSDERKRNDDAFKYKQHIIKHYSLDAVIPSFINLYKEL